VNTLPYRMPGTRNSHNVALGRAIQRLRKEAKLTQQQLADRAKVPVKELRQIEQGRVNADWGTVRYLAYGMEVNLADVFRLTEDLEPGGD
jgi:transcriptional regulator with XRE-family HTH domain